MAAAKLMAISVTSSLKSGEYKIRFCSKRKSDVWKEFGLVIDHSGAELDLITGILYVLCSDSILLGWVWVIVLLVG